MKSGGFPCRSDGCDVRFPVADQSSMPSLLEASAKRTEHEVGVHGYHHKRLDEHETRPLPFNSSGVGRKPKDVPI